MPSNRPLGARNSRTARTTSRESVARSTNGTVGSSRTTKAAVPIRSTVQMTQASKRYSHAVTGPAIGPAWSAKPRRPASTLMQNPRTATAS